MYSRNPIHGAARNILPGCDQLAHYFKIIIWFDFHDYFLFNYIVNYLNYQLIFACFLFFQLWLIFYFLVTLHDDVIYWLITNKSLPDIYFIIIIILYIYIASKLTIEILLQFNLPLFNIFHACILQLLFTVIYTQ